MSPAVTPSSMIAAFTVGRYSDARVLTSWKTTTATTNRRYGRDIPPQQSGQHRHILAPGLTAAQPYRKK